jgi:PPM family protein phosphatase
LIEQSAACYKNSASQRLSKATNLLHIQYGILSDQGRVRTSNEDSFAANADQQLFLVADGMGGHAAGEVASKLAASTMEDAIIHSGNDQPEAALLSAAVQANKRIHDTQSVEPELAGMGSTLTALSFKDDHYYIAHVGDSRAYLLRDGVLDQLTRDHSLVWHLFESGILRKEELSSHPQKNLITRSIGPHPQVEIDLERGDAREGDVYLLCSDGLTDVVPDDTIREILSDSQKSPQAMGEALVKTANGAGGPDNVTVVVVRIEPGEQEISQDS